MATNARLDPDALDKYARAMWGDPITANEARRKLVANCWRYHPPGCRCMKQGV